VEPVSRLPPLNAICWLPSKGLVPEAGPVTKETTPGPPVIQPEISAEPPGKTTPGGVVSIGCSKLPFWNAAADESRHVANVERVMSKETREAKNVFI